MFATCVGNCSPQPHNLILDGRSRPNRSDIWLNNVKWFTQIFCCDIGADFRLLFCVIVSCIPKLLVLRRCVVRNCDV